MEKDFDAWNELKKSLDKKFGFLPIKEGEVWWYACLAQFRLFSSNRSTDRMGTLLISDYLKIKNGFSTLNK